MEYDTFNSSNTFGENAVAGIDPTSVRLMTLQNYENMQRELQSPVNADPVVSMPATRLQAPSAWTPAVYGERSLRQPTEALVPPRRYTPEQIRRNRLKAFAVGGVLAVAAAIGFEQAQPADQTEMSLAAATHNVVDDVTAIAEPVLVTVPEIPTTTTSAAPTTTTTAAVASSIPSPRVVEAPQTSKEPVVGDNTPADNKRLAHMIAREEYNLSVAEIACMDKVVEGYGSIPGESGYKVDADNTQSTAYGIAQAMLSLHVDTIREKYPDYFEGTVQNPYGGNPATQIRWMLDYMLGKRGTVCNNWNYKVNHPTHAY